jgi:hypothetical protein
MTTLIKELRDALIEAGATPEKADAAAASVLPAEQTASKADFKEMELRLIKWIVGTGIAGAITVIGVMLRVLP